ncbi:MAG: HAMP domain-containing sensor histidine kinase [Acidobacteriota bacterium]
MSSLHTRLATALLLLLLAVGTLGIASTLITTRLHLEEANQSANLDLASNIAAMKESRLIDPDGEIRPEGLDEIFHWMMVVNPGVQFYLLDPEGTVLAYDPTPGPAQLERVSLQPIRDLMAGPEHLPMLGDDPRDPEHRKIISVAPLPLEGPTQGYLYIVLDNDPFETAAGRLATSHALRLSLWTGLGAVALALLFGFVIFRRLTKPLRLLTCRMQSFQRGNAAQCEPGDGDEVALLGATFDDMKDRIEVQMDQIERLAALKSELIANVSHDLRTPIAMLHGYLETLAIKELDDEKRRSYLAVALRQSDRLGKLVGELFELTKLEADDAEADMERFVLSELVQDNVQRFSLEAEERDVTIRAQFDPELPAVLGDIGLIERALQNLIDNALRFTAPGGSVTVTLDEIEMAGSKRLEVKVADTGCGISAEDLPFVFDRAFRCRFADADPRSSSGAGLGLAITQRIVRLHGGEVTVESELDVGTTFRFSLPIAPVPEPTLHWPEEGLARIA